MIPADMRILFLPLAVIALVALGATLMWMQAVLVPFIVAAFLSYLFKPIVQFLVGKKVPVALALLAVLGIVAVLIGGTGIFIVASMRSFVGALPRYEERMRIMADELHASLAESIPGADQYLASLKWENVIDMSTATAWVTSSVGSFFGVISNAILVLLFMMFILSGVNVLQAKIRKAFSPASASKILEVIQTVNERVRQYVVAKTGINLFGGLVTTGILYAMGVDFPVIAGFLSFILHYIPNLGSIISVVFPAVVAVLQFGSLGMGVLVAVVLAVTQMVVGNVLEPKWMERSLDLSPLLILVSLIFWGWLWGAVGMVLAIPIMSSIRIIFESIHATKPLAVLMAGDKSVQ